ncbi:transposase [Streptomyces sp. A1547]|uniref:transposase n=1 Tax=Streptomyces sp. A1547 TaxID=2563105 RepID=UPI001F0CFBE6|nr:transposase [Streptomyces sp. A1547]
MITAHGAGRSHGRGVGDAGAVVVAGDEGGRPPVWSRRPLIDGIRFRVRTGVPWRDVPVEYGPWVRGCDLFRRWQRNGTWPSGSSPGSSPWPMRRVRSRGT